MAASTESADSGESFECRICGDVFENIHGLGIHQGLSHSDSEIESVLLDELRRLATELDRTPTYSQMNDHGRFSPVTYKNRFESWNNALDAAGLELNVRQDISRSELLEELRRLAAELDRTPTAPQMDEHGCFSSVTYENQFESWNDALDAAGLELNVRQDISRSELLDELRRLAAELGRTPTTAQMDEHGRFSPVTYKNQFESWNHALDAAGLELNQRSDGDGLRERLCYGPRWPAVAHDIRSRDGHRCRVCGGTGVTGRSLHVHHITPARTFEDDAYDEMNDPSNLITLCVSCHRVFEGCWQWANPDTFTHLARLAKPERAPPALPPGDTDVEPVTPAPTDRSSQARLAEFTD